MPPTPPPRTCPHAPTQPPDPHVEEAQAILKKKKEEQTETPGDLLKLAKNLVGGKRKKFALARKILKIAREKVAEEWEAKRKDPTREVPKRTEIYQKSALYTYKDPDLPVEWRLERALEILEELEAGGLSQSTDQETLGLAGAIFKRKWEAGAQRPHLERSLWYYLRGYAQGMSQPQDAPPPAPRAAEGETRPQEETAARTEEAAERAPVPVTPAPPPAAPDEPNAGRLTDVIGFLSEARRLGRNVKVSTTDNRGYTGINAAFIYDQLAHLGEKEARAVGFESESARQMRDSARLIREEIARTLPLMEEAEKKKQQQEAAEKKKQQAEQEGRPLAGAGPDADKPPMDWWFYATLAEAHFGLGQYDKAKQYLATGKKVNDDEWERESTARQFAALARLSEAATAGGDLAGATDVLAEFLGHDADAVRSAFVGRVGLALSGGGFRASLYQIGVLARLAELDVLRHVEVISCVSGGSIVGAYYYLKLRKLLHDRADGEIDPRRGGDGNVNDYVNIVREIEQEFLAGVQRNIRTRLFAEFFANLKMIVFADYSRTMRAGELYERELYSRVEDGLGRFEGSRRIPDWMARLFGLKREPRYINDLRICPRGDEHGDDFKPKDHNWKRRHKAPILILNAATLNTGHLWHFTATYMGEPPSRIERDIDSNDRLRRMYYEHAPAKHQRVRLGYAVAASACVPGIFEPLALDGLYPNHRVLLVDGGACDNQGISGLLEQDCNVMLVSDGSGQLETEGDPGTMELGVLWRSNNLTMARVREAQYQDITARRRTGLLRDMLFVHLKQDLGAVDVAWSACPEEWRVSEFERGSGGRADTDYGVERNIQKRLAMIRTDLDSFSDAEAYALMASGYRMTEHKFKTAECLRSLPLRDDRCADWKFLRVEQQMKPGGEKRAELERVLTAGGSTFFKIWKLSRILKYGLRVLAAVAVILALWASYRRPDANLLPAGVFRWLQENLTYSAIRKTAFVTVALTVASMVFTYFFGQATARTLMRLVKLRDTLTHLAAAVAMCLVGWLVARVHLHLFDWLFLRYGRIGKFGAAGAAGSASAATKHLKQNTT